MPEYEIMDRTGEGKVTRKQTNFHFPIPACLSGAVGQTLPAVLRPSWVFYLGSVISSFSPAATITARTMSSRCVEEDEVGRIFAVISLMSALSSSLVSAAYQVPQELGGYN